MSKAPQTYVQAQVFALPISLSWLISSWFKVHVEVRVTPPPSPFPVIPRPLHVSEHRPPQGLTSFPYKQNIHILTHTGVHTCCLYELRRCCYTLSSVHILINNTDKGPETDGLMVRAVFFFKHLKDLLLFLLCAFSS